MAFDSPWGANIRSARAIEGEDSAAAGSDSLAAGATIDEFRAPASHPARPHPPTVQLGRLQPGGLAPAIMAIVERGAHHRPALAGQLHAEVELVLEEGYPPVRIVFGGRHVLVEDGPGVAPELRVVGALADLVGLMVAPLVSGVPSPASSRGRAALGMLASGRVRFQGRLGLMRRFLRLVRV